MRPFLIDPTTEPPAELIGAVVTHDATAAGKRVFAKGRQLGVADLAVLPTLDAPVHAVLLDADEVHENLAGARLARAVAGPGVRIEGPAQGRYNLVSAHRGLLRIDSDRLLRINLLPALSVFTLPDQMAVNADVVVTGVKITPVAAPEASLLAAEALSGEEPVIDVLAFLPKRVGVLSTEPMSDRMRARFQETVRQKIAWYGGEVIRFAEPEPTADAVVAAARGLLSEGAEVLLAAGGSTMDPLDPTQLALPVLGAEMIRFGAPAHPGSMFWIAAIGDTKIVNLASCTLYSRATVADLVLPWIMAGQPVTPELVAAIGFGGLLDQGVNDRFPPYQLDLKTPARAGEDASA